jgi:hypothetical protein
MSEYMLKAHGGGDDGFHFHQWKIEGSNDELDWDIIDERNTDEMIPSWSTRTFKRCPSLQISSFYRYIRLMQTGPNSGCPNADYLMLCNIEFFGVLR